MPETIRKRGYTVVLIIFIPVLILRGLNLTTMAPRAGAVFAVAIALTLQEALSAGLLRCGAYNNLVECSALTGAYAAWGGKPDSWALRNGTDFCGNTTVSPWQGVTCSSGQIINLCALSHVVGSTHSSGSGLGPRACH